MAFGRGPGRRNVCSAPHQASGLPTRLRAAPGRRQTLANGVNVAVSAQRASRVRRVGNQQRPWRAGLPFFVQSSRCSRFVNAIGF